MCVQVVYYYCNYFGGTKQPNVLVQCRTYQQAAADNTHTRPQKELEYRMLSLPTTVYIPKSGDFYSFLHFVTTFTYSILVRYDRIQYVRQDLSRNYIFHYHHHPAAGAAEVVRFIH